MDELKAYASIGMNALHVSLLDDNTDPEGIFLYEENITLADGKTITVPVYARADQADDNDAAVVRLQIGSLPREVNRDAALRGALLAIMNSVREGVKNKEGTDTIKQILCEMGMASAVDINPDIIQSNGYAGLICNDDIAQNQALLGETIFEMRFKTPADAERLSDDVFGKYDIVRAADGLKKREPLHRADNLISDSADVEESVKEAVWNFYLPLRRVKAGGEVKLPYGVAVYKNISQLRQAGRPDMGEGKITDLAAFIKNMAEMNVDTVMLDNIFDKLVRYIDWSKVEGTDPQETVVTESAYIIEHAVAERDAKDAQKAYAAYRHNNNIGDLNSFMDETARSQFKKVLRDPEIMNKVQVTFNVVVKDGENLEALEKKINEWVKLGFGKVFLDLSGLSTVPEKWIDGLAGKLGKDSVGIIPSQSPALAAQARLLAARLDAAYVDRIPYGVTPRPQAAGENVIRMMYIEEGKPVISKDDVEGFKNNVQTFVRASENAAVIAMPDLASGAAANDAQFRDVSSGHADDNVYKDFLVKLTAGRAFRPKSLAEAGEAACRTGYKVSPEKVNAAEFAWFNKAREISLPGLAAVFSGRGLSSVISAVNYMQQADGAKLEPVINVLQQGKLFDETLNLIGRLKNAVDNRNWLALERQVILLKNRLPSNASSDEIVRSHMELANLVRGASEHVVEAEYYARNKWLEKFVNERDNSRFRAILFAAHTHGAFERIIETAKDGAVHRIGNDMAAALNRRDEIKGSYFKQMVNMLSGKDIGINIENARAAYEALPTVSGLRALVPMIVFVKAVASVRGKDAKNKTGYVLDEMRSIMQPQIDALQKTGTLPEFTGKEDNTVGWALAESARIFPLVAERRAGKPAETAIEILSPALTATLRTQG
ncbi:MAG: hypothetical protein A2293_04030 [Elusimicrobia bacterium RIFOXYB2_FULL_49_7]|nr:MAG: hypothetical protein A2293_04030 [Elusimicrobia bacterium RIFOXYB2_FULL_49_7]